MRLPFRLSQGALTAGLLDIKYLKKDAYMNCPVCKSPMIVLEVDYCAACEGIWLDAGELELLAEDPAASVLSTNAPAPESAEEKRRCPICGTRMFKNQSPGAHAVIYNRCPKGDGLWFDRGKLATARAGRIERQRHRKAVPPASIRKTAFDIKCRGRYSLTTNHG